jgi:quercetin dioxygenase-like cupin family protein
MVRALAGMAALEFSKKEGPMKKVEIFKEGKFKDGSMTRVLVHESPYLKVINFNIKAGQMLPLHSHDIEGEVSIAVLSGSGEFLGKDGLTLPAEVGDVLVCAISEPHGVMAKSDLRIMATIAPPI